MVIFDRELYLRTLWTTTLLLFMVAIKAATPLPANQIKIFLPGSTVEYRDRQGRRVEAMFHGDGLLKGRRYTKTGKTDVGEWWVPRDGKVCWKWRAWGGGKKYCRDVERGGDGVYLVNSAGKRWAVSQ